VATPALPPDSRNAGPAPAEDDVSVGTDLGVGMTKPLAPEKADAPAVVRAAWADGAAAAGPDGTAIAASPDPEPPAEESDPPEMSVPDPEACSSIVTGGVIFGALMDPIPSARAAMIAAWISSAAARLARDRRRSAVGPSASTSDPLGPGRGPL